MKERHLSKCRSLSVKRSDWARRNVERKAVWERARELTPIPPSLKPKFDAASGRSASEHGKALSGYQQRLMDRYRRSAGHQIKAKEQDNDRDKGDRER